MILAVVQARMGSSRLPGKVMRPIMGRPLIGYLLERLRCSKKIGAIVVATTTSSQDDGLRDYVEQNGIEVFRGEEEDVLDRYYQAAKPKKPSAVCRITADCPLIDYEVVDRVIDLYGSGRYDYVSNVLKRPVYPKGMDTEVIRYEALETAWKEATLPSDREHVTPYFYKSAPKRFERADLHPETDFFEERWTVDHEEDFVLVRTIFEHLYKKGSYFGLKEILAFQKSYPALFEINRHIDRNEGYHKSLEKDRRFGRQAK